MKTLRVLSQAMLGDVQFDEHGWVPAVIQDYRSHEVLMLAYMNRESLEKTFATGETWFFSRSRESLWHKGETSGNTQKVVQIALDCDQDTLLILVDPSGPACHTGAVSCFYDPNITVQDLEPNLLDSSILLKLEALVSERERLRPEGAYTTYLFTKGIDKILKKVGEETAEVIIAAKNQSAAEVQYEVADLLYHLLVMLKQQNVRLSDVFAELSKRYVQPKEAK